MHFRKNLPRTIETEKGDLIPRTRGRFSACIPVSAYRILPAVSRTSPAFRTVKVFSRVRDCDACQMAQSSLVVTKVTLAQNHHKWRSLIIAGDSTRLVVTLRLLPETVFSKPKNNR